jgi:hypothetical protein
MQRGAAKSKNQKGNNPTPNPDRATPRNIRGMAESGGSMPQIGLTIPIRPLALFVLFQLLERF